jgi:hypothetical protein
VLIAYFDESYGEGVYCVAGYVASSKTWDEVTAEWQAILGARPAVPHFHMKEALGRNGYFRQLSKVQIDAKIDALIGVVERHSKKMFGVLCVVEEAPLRAILRPELVGPLYSDPYDFCIKRCIASTRQARDERNMHDKVRFIFDNGPLSEAERSDIHRYVKEIEADNAQFIAGDVLFENDIAVVALQLSDLVTWHLHRYAVRRVLPEPDSRLARLMKPGFNPGWWNSQTINGYLLPMLELVAFSGQPKTLADLRAIRQNVKALGERLGAIAEAKAGPISQL